MTLQLKRFCAAVFLLAALLHPNAALSAEEAAGHSGEEPRSPTAADTGTAPDADQPSKETAAEGPAPAEPSEQAETEKPDAAKQEAGDNAPAIFQCSFESV